MINVGIVGGTGYTGVELLRLLAQHPHARVRAVSSRTEAGTPVADYFPACVDSSTSSSVRLTTQTWGVAT